MAHHHLHLSTHPPNKLSQTCFFSHSTNTHYRLRMCVCVCVLCVCMCKERQSERDRNRERIYGYNALFLPQWPWDQDEEYWDLPYSRHQGSWIWDATTLSLFIVSTWTVKPGDLRRLLIFFITCCLSFLCDLHGCYTSFVLVCCWLPIDRCVW